MTVEELGFSLMLVVGERLWLSLNVLDCLVGRQKWPLTGGNVRLTLASVAGMSLGSMPCPLLVASVFKTSRAPY